MALDVSKLTTMILDNRLAAMQSEIDAVEDAGTKAAVKARLKADSNAIAKAVIEHVTAAMEIEVNPADISVPAGIAVTTTGSAAAQAGATSAPGKATGTIKGSAGRIS
jgi:hypothetical protein